MPTEEKISLDCPCCKGMIYQPLGWFKKTYATCPACGAGVAAGQFATAVADIEAALDAQIEEMVHGSPPSGCCGGHHH